jgi:hypothetical protein
MQNFGTYILKVPTAKQMKAFILQTAVYVLNGRQVKH